MLAGKDKQHTRKTIQTMKTRKQRINKKRKMDIWVQEKATQHVTQQNKGRLIGPSDCALDFHHRTPCWDVAKIWKSTCTFRTCTLFFMTSLHRLFSVLCVAAACILTPLHQAMSACEQMKRIERWTTCTNVPFNMHFILRDISALLVLLSCKYFFFHTKPCLQTDSTRK